MCIVEVEANAMVYILPIWRKKIMSNIRLFQAQQVRTHWDNKQEKWFFSIVDVIGVISKRN